MMPSAGNVELYLNGMDGIYDKHHPAAAIMTAVWAVIAVGSGHFVLLGIRRGIEDTQLFFAALNCFILGNGITITVLGIWPAQAMRNDDERDNRLFLLIAGPLELAMVLVMFLTRRRVRGILSAVLDAGVRKFKAHAVAEDFVPSGAFDLQDYECKAKAQFQVLEDVNTAVGYAAEVSYDAAAEEQVKEGSDFGSNRGRRGSRSSMRRGSTNSVSAISRLNKSTWQLRYGHADFFVVAAPGTRFARRHRFVLQQVAAQFESVHSRKPTFWTTQSLASAAPPPTAGMLPTFAAGCKRALVLLSDELIKDPLGVLELYTAMTIHSSKISVIPVGGYVTPSSIQLVVDLKNFDAQAVAKAAFDSPGHYPGGITWDDAVSTLNRVLAKRGGRAVSGPIRDVQTILAMQQDDVQSAASRQDNMQPLISEMLRSQCKPAELTIAMFDALATGHMDAQIPRLVKAGAEPAQRSPKTLQLPHTFVLSRADPDPEVLFALFSVRCEIDTQIRTAAESTPAKLKLLMATLSRMATQGWQQESDGKTVLHCVVDACQTGHIGDDFATELAHQVLLANPGYLMMPDKSSKSPGEYSMLCKGAQKLQKLLTVVVFGSYQLTHPSEHLYKSPTALVMDCRDMSLIKVTKLKVALAFEQIDADRDGQIGRLDAKAAGLTEEEFASIDVDGDGFLTLEEFSRWQEKEEPVELVIKLMSDKQSWRREMRSRDMLKQASDFIVPIMSAATTESEDAEDPDPTNVLVRRFSGTATHLVAARLCKEYPYAIVMEKAERNLLEIINNERLAAQPIATIRRVLWRIAQCVAAMHSQNIIHGDIKPRNIVRTKGQKYKLIDLDLALTGSEATAQHRPGHDGLRRSAYASPEMLKWARAGDGNLEVEDTPQDGTNGCRLTLATTGVDMWSLGMLAYELVCGMPLVQQSYDQVTEVSLNRLLAWRGVSAADEDQVRQMHGAEDISVLLELLRFTLASKIKDRPHTISEFLSHPFFEEIRHRSKVAREIVWTDLTRQNLIRELDGGVVYWKCILDEHRKSGVPPYAVAAKSRVGESTDGTARKQLLAEARLMSKCDHRNVLSIVGVCSIPETSPVQILLEFCEGGWLSDELFAKGSPSFSVPKLLTCCAEVLRGLAHLARLRIVHRDVGLQNILLTTLGVVKISDFTLSVTLPQNKDFVKIRKGRIALRHAAPEVLNEGRFSAASDVWAAGVLCYEVFTSAAQPYTEDAPNEDLVREFVLGGGRLKLQLGSCCPENVFQELLQPCWKSDPADRPTLDECYNVAVHFGAQEDQLALEERRSRTKRAHALQQASNGYDVSLVAPSIEYLIHNLVPDLESVLSTLPGGPKDATGGPVDVSKGTSYHILEHIVKPRTTGVICTRDQKPGAVYVDMLDAKSKGQATCMLSYAWRYPLSLVGAALNDWSLAEGADTADTFVWIDVLCWNQHGRIGDPVGQWMSRVEKVGHQLTMLHPWDAPVYVTRAWCIFELWFAIKKDCAVTTILAPEDAKAYRAAINSSGFGVIDTVLANIDAESARAYNADDLADIRKKVNSREGGFESLSNTIRTHLSDWFSTQGGIRGSSETGADSAAPPEKKRGYSSQRRVMSATSADAGNSDTSESDEVRSTLRPSSRLKDNNATALHSFDPIIPDPGPPPIIVASQPNRDGAGDVVEQPSCFWPSSHVLHLTATTARSPFIPACFRGNFHSRLAWTASKHGCNYYYNVTACYSPGVNRCLSCV